jgi:tryptophanyl-tRNA synthetase
LKDVINKSIVTDATKLEDPKDPNANSITALYELIAGANEAAVLREKLLAGNFGWGHAKKELLEAILSRFETERKKYFEYISDYSSLENILKQGGEKARVTASNTLDRVRKNLGYSV